MIRYSARHPLMASPALAQDAGTAAWARSTKSSRTPAAQIAMSVRTTCRSGLDPVMGPSRGRTE